MFPLRERKRDMVKFITALLIAGQIMFFGITVFNYVTNVDSRQNEASSNIANLQDIRDSENISGLKDNWEILSTLTPNQGVKSELKNSNQLLISDKLYNLAEKYKADPEYLDYIVKVEKKFNLEPCELLALIAQESGFKPQTHMDGGSLSYSTTQMKMPTAKTAYMAITEYYKMDIPYPTHELLNDDKYYAAFLAGGYLRYLQDTYKDKYEAYTAYNWGIGGRMTFYNSNGHFKSPYALKVANLGESFIRYVGSEYYVISNKITQTKSYYLV